MFSTLKPLGTSVQLRCYCIRERVQRIDRNTPCLRAPLFFFVLPWRAYSGRPNAGQNREDEAKPGSFNVVVVPASLEPAIRQVLLLCCLLLSLLLWLYMNVLAVEPVEINVERAQPSAALFR